MDLEIEAPDVDAQVDTLEAKGLIRVAAYRPELEYLFRHGLVQDAAYGSLLKQERRELHRQVGEALEALYPDRHAELAGILAMHFEQAGETDKAIDYLVADGRYALERNAIQRGLRRLRPGLRLLAPAVRTTAGRRRAARVDRQSAGARPRGLTFRPAAELLAELEELVAGRGEAPGDMELIAQVHLWIVLVLLETRDRRRRSGRAPLDRPPRGDRARRSATPAWRRSRSRWSR